MKTKLPLSISTVDEAKTFLLELCKNNEQYHPEDDAHDLEWVTIPPANIPTIEECDQLNKLMQDIYNLKGNENVHSMIIDPCEVILNAMDSKRKTA